MPALAYSNLLLQHRHILGAAGRIEIAMAASCAADDLPVDAVKHCAGTGCCTRDNKESCVGPRLRKKIKNCDIHTEWKCVFVLAGGETFRQ